MNKRNKGWIIRCAVIGGSVLAIAGGLTIAAMANGGNLDLLLGQGKEHKISASPDMTAEYIDYKYENQDETGDKSALVNARNMTRETAEEGITLLKNDDNALPLNKSSDKVTILGYYSWHNNMSGGEDPANTAGAVSLGKGIEAAFTTNTAVNDLYASAKDDFADPSASLASASGTFGTYDTAVITIKRNSGEGNDQTTDSGASENNRTGLTINKAEWKLIDYASKNFKKVIIVINAANTMELGFLDENDPNVKKGTDGSLTYTDPYGSGSYDVTNVKAALWAGCCGSQGGTALAEILAGDVNPSGHLVDTYARDLTKDPTWNNFGSYKYDNSRELNSYQDETFFVDYEEGIYIGYRYYETAAYEAKNNNYAGFNYDNAVVYPFGYGLSYTNFSMEYVGTPTYDESTGNFDFKVKVKNTGSVAGKGVAQIYVNTPYISGGVEKAHVVLGGFAKTATLKANEEQTLDITINRDYFTSYDYTDEKCYILDAGAYNFYLSDNAHSWDGIDAAKTWTWNLASKQVYKDGKAGKRVTDLSVATNKEDDELNYKFKKWSSSATAGDGYCYDFTRANFKDSFPTAPVKGTADYKLTDSRALKQVAKYQVWDAENQYITDRPTTDSTATSYVLSDMRGVDFNDKKWTEYIQQFSVDSMVNMFCNGGWNELADEKNGVPISYDADSPYGYYAHALSIKNVNKWYCGDPMVAATYNTELARRLGEAFGEESYANKQVGGSLITGLYGFGGNTHRSAFGGRNYEYYSEDPILGGKMAAAEASGASEKGLITFMKHFVLNEQETNRQKNGFCAWVNEQAFREIYVKVFEIYIKEAKMEVKYYAANEETGKYEMTSKTMSAATGIMTSYNRVGANWAGASVCLQDILEDEFGYTGTNVTDAGGEPDTYMTTDYMLRRGGHLTLSNNGNDGLFDTTSNTAIYHLQDSTHHLLYNKANSNIMQGYAPGDHVYYDMAPWRIGVIAAWIVLGVLAAADIAFIVLLATDVIKLKEKEPKAAEAGSSEEF